MKLAIKGHPKEGNKVIEILEMLGGRDVGYGGIGSHYYYYVDEYGNIAGTTELPESKTFVTYTLEEFLKKFPYNIGNKVTHSDYESPLEIVGMKWEDDSIKYEVYTNDYGYWFSVDELQPYKEETMGNKPNLLQRLKEYFDNTPRDVLEKEWNELSYLNEIGPTVDEYLECVKKYRQSNQYPKTYEECCKVLGCKADDFFTDFSYDGCDVEISDYEDKIDDLLQNFRKLRYCRDAYWKIAGEQLGLGKPWSPSKNDNVYCIFRLKGEIVKDNFVFGDSIILEFPTEEMRDAFYENFKDLIEQCKELL